jgi:hypothetical protein
MIDVTELVGILFSGLSALVIEDAEDAGDMIAVRAVTRNEPVACPGCDAQTSRVYGYHERTAADVHAAEGADARSSQVKRLASGRPKHHSGNPVTC